MSPTAAPERDGACPVCGARPTRFACRALLCAACERDIRDCPACGAAFYQPLPSPSEIGRCYPRRYFAGFFRQYWQDYYKGRALARTLSAFRASGSLLDVGCALGTLLAGFRDHSSWTVSGLELSQEAATMGRELNGVDIACAALAQAPWPDASFDCVHLNNVLEHESDPAAALAAASRMLRPGGRLLLTLPNGPVDLLANRILFRKWGRAVPTRHGGHLFFLSRRAVGILLERAGLKAASIRCFHWKSGLKARGWLPGAWRQFRSAARASAPEDSLTLDGYRALIRRKPSWPLYLLRWRLRRISRWSWGAFGYDLEVVAHK